MQAQIIFPTQETPLKAVKGDPVYEAFKRATLQLIAAGHTRFSPRDIVGYIRWFTAVHEGKDSSFKCNNNRTAWMARKFMADHPEHEGFFQLRPSKYDDII